MKPSSSVFPRLPLAGLWLSGILLGIPRPAPAASKAQDRAVTSPSQAAPTAAPAAPAANPAAQGSKADVDVTVKGKSKVKVTIGKAMPPAAFRLEEIQNFPEERLGPVLQNPVTFNEGRDFIAMMTFREEQPLHPWLPDIQEAPFLTMEAPRAESVRSWDFSVIDQGGAPVYRLEGKGRLPRIMDWDGSDKLRRMVAVDTVYIPQVKTENADGYHRTWMGNPVQFSAVRYSDQGKAIIELSSRRIFEKGKDEWTGEAPKLMDKLVDIIKAENILPLAIQPYDDDADLARKRQMKIVDYLKKALVVSDRQVVTPAPHAAGQRGAIFAILASALPGGRQ